MLRCIRCAACLTSCPTYVVTHKEEEGPRGRIAIMRAIVEGHLEVTPDAVEHLDNCVLCEACTNVCPAGVQMESMGIAFRESLAATRTAGGRSLPVRFAFAWLFGDLAHFRLLGRLIWFYQRSGVQWLARHSGMLRLLGMHGMESMLPEVPLPARFVVPGTDCRSGPAGPGVRRLHHEYGLCRHHRGHSAPGGGVWVPGGAHARPGVLRRAAAALGRRGACTRAGAAECRRVWRRRRADRGQRRRLWRHVEALRASAPRRAARGGPVGAGARRERVPGAAPADPPAARGPADGHPAGRVSPAPRAADL